MEDKPFEFPREEQKDAICDETSLIFVDILFGSRVSFPAKIFEGNNGNVIK